MIGNEGIARVFAGQDASQRKAFRQIHRYVFQRMHGDVGAAFTEGHFQFLDEQPLAAHLAQRAVQDLVAQGGHAQQFDLPAQARLQQRLDVFGLPQRQPAFTRGNHHTKGV